MKNKATFLPLILLSGALLVACDNGQSSSSKSSTSTDSSSSKDPYVGPYADGVYDYTTADYEEKLNILASLESYTLKNHLAGIPLYDDSSYQQFSNRITLPTTTYITNYGFGIGEATLDESKTMYNGMISGESVEAWKPYFHDYTSIDSGTFNYWDSQGADVAGRSGMISASYFEVEMNEKKDDYVWKQALSKTVEPIMLKATGSKADGTYKLVEETDPTVKASNHWRVKLKTGEDGIRYAVPSSSKWYSKYNGVGVKLEDYLTPFKAMLDNKFTRASSMADDASGFEGASDYMYSGKADWSNVGIQVNEEEGSMDFSFITAKTMNYARTNLSSSLYSPVPAQFLTDIGGASNYGVHILDSDPYKGLDNIISCGAYVPVYWQKDSKLVYEKNLDYYDAGSFHYKGVTEVVISGTNADVLAYQKFLANELDEVTIPTTYLKEHKSDLNVYQTKGDTVIKMNLNTCTEDEWEYYFGTEGIVSQYRHKKENYWAVKPIMSNDDFADGLYFSIDRKTMSEDAGRNSALGYLSNAYTQDPDAKEFYRDSEQGKAVLAKYIEASDEYGHSDELAKGLFSRAINTLVANGDYSDGDEISIEVFYRYQTTIDNLGKYIETAIENNFNNCEAAKAHNIKIDLVLKVADPNNYAGAYTLMDKGEYDMAEGAISGNVLNPLEFMNTCCTNSLSQGFCLNWGNITSKVETYEPIIYDGVAWSYDALFQAATSTTVVMNGESIAVAQDPKMITETVKGVEYVSLSAKYPEFYDEQGELQIQFKGSEYGVFTSSSGSFQSGFYAEATLVVANGEVKMRVTKANVEKYAKQTARTEGATQNYVLFQYSLSFQFAGGKWNNKTVYSYASFADLGMSPIAPSYIPDGNGTGFVGNGFVA